MRSSAARLRVDTPASSSAPRILCVSAASSCWRVFNARVSVVAALNSRSSFLLGLLFISCASAAVFACAAANSAPTPCDSIFNFLNWPIRFCCCSSVRKLCASSPPRFVSSAVSIPASSIALESLATLSKPLTPAWISIPALMFSLAIINPLKIC